MIIPSLAEFARDNIKKFGFENIIVLNIDGSMGYKNEMPFDKIIMTAATSEIPEILIKQLKEGGILIAPIGPEFSQNMIKDAVARAEENKRKTIMAHDV